jgi:hypothetical protein
MKTTERKHIQHGEHVHKAPNKLSHGNHSKQRVKQQESE